MANSPDTYKFLISLDFEHVGSIDLVFLIYLTKYYYVVSPSDFHTSNMDRQRTRHYSMHQLAFLVGSAWAGRNRTYSTVKW